MKNEHKLFVICVFASIAFGALAAIFVSNFLPRGNGQLMAEFYAAETAVGVSPADYAADLNAGILDGTLVDLRSKSEYGAGHFVTAVSIPAVEMNKKQVLDAFSVLPKGKPVITYCYSEYCMLSREVGNVLAQNGIYAKHFTAGWYEIQRDLPQYIVNGTGPGNWKNATYSPGICVQGEFRC